MNPAFFYVVWTDKEGGGFARGTHDPELHRLLDAGGPVEAWSPLELDLEPARYGRYDDYLGNNVGVRLCSARMRAIIDQSDHSGRVQWLDVTVRDPAGTELPYSVLHLTWCPDVLHPTRTVTAGPALVKPVLDRTKVDGPGLDVFGVDPVGTTWFVSRALKRSLEAAACTGMLFSKLAMA